MTEQKQSMFPLVLLVIAVGMIGFGWYNLSRMPESPYPEMQPEFSLHDASGPVSSKLMLGKVGMVFFGYTHCPDICPATLVNMGKALDMLEEEEREKVRPVFISIDAARDAPAKVEKYARYFHPQILGLSGSAEEVATAAKSFLVAYEKNAPNAVGNYTVSHSTYVLLLSPDGKIAELIGHKENSPEGIAKAARRWLKWAD